MHMRVGPPRSLWTQADAIKIDQRAGSTSGPAPIGFRADVSLYAMNRNPARTSSTLSR